jgi:hypothetical protein
MRKLPKGVALMDLSPERIRRLHQLPSAVIKILSDPDLLVGALGDREAAGMLDGMVRAAGFDGCANCGNRLDIAFLCCRSGVTPNEALRALAQLVDLGVVDIPSPWRGLNWFLDSEVLLGLAVNHLLRELAQPPTLPQSFQTR